MIVPLNRARQAVFCRVSCTGRWNKCAWIGRPSRGRLSIAVVAMIASRTIIIRHPPQAWGTPITTTINWYTKRTSNSIPPGLSCVVRPTLPLAPRKPLSFSGSEHLFGTQAGVAAVHYHSIQTTSTTTTYECNHVHHGVRPDCLMYRPLLAHPITVKAEDTTAAIPPGTAALLEHARPKDHSRDHPPTHQRTKAHGVVAFGSVDVSFSICD